MRVQARKRILGHKHCKLPAGRPFFTNSGLRTDSISGQARDTTVQVWTVGKGLGIRSEFSQTVCAANNFRHHEVLLRWFKGAGDQVSRLTLVARTHGTFRTLAISVRALRHFNLRSF
jgi:hypothetical protein